MIGDFDLKPEPEEVTPAFRLDSMAQADLLALRMQIDAKLKLELKDMDLPQELALQFAQAKSLLNEIVDDNDVPANQKAQVLNSATSILASIAKAQEALYSAERLKTIESALIKALKTLPREAQEAFFSIYSKYLLPETL